MAGFDGGNVYFSYQGHDVDPPADDIQFIKREMVNAFKQFIKEYEINQARNSSGQRMLYQDRLIEQQTYLEVDLQHIRAAERAAAATAQGELRGFGNGLSAALEERPAESLPLLEEACVQVLQEARAVDPRTGLPRPVEAVQVLLYCSTPLSGAPKQSIRELDASRVSKLVQLQGIVTATSRPRHKATFLTLQCTACRATKTVPCRPGLATAFFPQHCDMSTPPPGSERCPPRSLVVLPDRSGFVDQQTIKIQERPEDVPTGEMPRSVLVVADRRNCGSVAPGSRVIVTGVYGTFKGRVGERENGNGNNGGSSGSNVAALQQPYVRSISVVQEDGDARSAFKFAKDEVQTFEQFARRSDVYDKVFGMIAPNVYGSDDIKRAITCALFGGSRKALPDGTRRRGDINVLLLGDPGVAKSQLLKFAARAAPVSVYTSGKGSSAAGLTAAVVQEAGSRDFYLEGGAMVLADGGLVCIDEFDKMRPEDRVAIHEAMEQQTISIAKAGITTMLRARTAVLAAANPPSGRYDDLKTAQENIDLQSTILSRFDLIFIVKDRRDMDVAIARHVLENHRRGAARRPGESGALDPEELANKEELEFLRRFIHYCRTQCSPRLTEEAEEKLAAFYQSIREEARQQAEMAGSDQPPVPVTVRQLEAVVRISESLARISLLPNAGPSHVDAAIQLFRRSTMDAVKSGVSQLGGDLSGSAQLGHARRLEERIRRRLHIGSSLTLRRLLDEMAALGEAEHLAIRVILAMASRGELALTRERSLVTRLR
uniref:DNA replication licensing factor MCM5 n=1 Tax=Polytomella parva TaxID=51329 RepID=A0A7S0UW25_9CHLO|mmetsp:Transcript_20210/g.36321  ORF Transcript_20210/g.36321 Transcript_20210/m.36321 type:complete len:772 (+) Transcript_20210:146-2461(+)|eukprot:CAMPEP_0175043352 /NCGR_PEP_ID=MMETSP0052_2-20121109/3128_1 /TAXON_ID=51329 ORGANISM="Polytomella parva, Strain SAG 63-3" /NCGR_SAMPLE_ID=MMETSP0052_2 /ASSEMBLY_ACC=CAM_ASM_000194 /LENGTH=771 /DNA_ID=CAMNT_0016306379 /DNA_START=78 /DNA_END=2393 /DNA_ORIENTATION=-